jgi:hypothetical protein
MTIEQKYHHGFPEGLELIVRFKFVIDNLMEVGLKKTSVLFRACREEIYHNAWEHVRHIQHKV